VSWFWEQGLHIQLNIAGAGRMKRNGGKETHGWMTKVLVGNPETLCH
jgi:hypothetical protein